MSPAVGQSLLGRFRVESVRDLGAAGAAGAASDEGGAGVSFVAVPVSGATAVDVPQRLADRDRYRIGATGIARPLAAALDGELLVVVYERRYGESLADWIARGACAPAAAGNALTQIAAALALLHDQGIAFGALRAELVRIGPEGVSLEGFALDALLGALGAELSLVPEACRAPELGTPTPASDSFALGALATELVIGRALRPADARPTPRACGIDVSDEVEALISKAVARSAAARPVDVARWAQELAEALLRPHVPLVAAPTAEPPAEAPATAPPPWATPPEPPPPEPAPAPAAAPRAPAPAPAPRAPAPAPAPRFDSMPPSKRGGGNALWVIALAAGLLLMLAGVGGLFAYSLWRETPVPATGAADAGSAAEAAAPLPPPPPPPPEAPDAAGAADAEVAAAEPDASVPLPSMGLRVVSAADVDSPLPLPADVPVWGSDKALVTLVVFGDLECPHTRRAYRGLESLLRAFPSEVRVAFRHRPLAIHSRAKDAAKVAIGVRREQGDAAFWRFVAQAASTTHDANRIQLEKWVKDAGGQPNRIETWLAQAEVENELGRDLQLAGLFDVRETPTLFVNGLRVDGFTSYDDLKRAVEKELSAARSLLALGTALPELYATRVRKNLMGLGKDVAERTCPAVAGSPVRGAADALVTLVEFSDFECPYCRRVQPALDTLLARHGGDLRIVWKNFPLDHHTRARPAAAFALEAFEKGGPTKFWKAHDLLFSAQADLTDAGLEKVALQIGMAPGPLLEASRQRARDPKIDADARLGQKLGVRGTPAFFVNGRALSGAQPLERFEALVKEELESARHLVASGTARSRVYDAICGVR